MCRALTNDTSSALLRHEVAYVLGQLQHPFAIQALEMSLRRSQEHFMVRHKSAEALGAIETTHDEWNRIETILQEFTHDSDPVVRESCLVALDAADYWGHASDGTATTVEGSENNAASDDNQQHEKSISAFAQHKAQPLPTKGDAVSCS
jgi:HEAT repeat protein